MKRKTKQPPTPEEELPGLEEEEELELQRQELLERWSQAAEELAAEYPRFRLDREAEDPKFRALLAAGVGLKTAYEALHLEEIKAAVAQHSAQERERALLANIRARGARPVENGALSPNALTSGVDLERMTKAQRSDFARRAMKGETITFR